MAVDGGEVVQLVEEGRGACGTGWGTEVEVAESLRAGRSCHVWRRASAVEVEIMRWDWNHHFHLHFVGAEDFDMLVFA